MGLKIFIVMFLVRDVLLHFYFRADVDFLGRTPSDPEKNMTTKHHENILTIKL